MSEKYYYIKLSCPNNNDASRFKDLFLGLNRQGIVKNFILNNVPNNLQEANIGDKIIIQLGGDSSNKTKYFSDYPEFQNFTNGLYAVATLLSLDRDNKEITLTAYAFERYITKIDLFQYPQFLNNLGCASKGIPNQAGLYQLNNYEAFGFFEYLSLSDALGKAALIIEPLKYQGSLEKGFSIFKQENPEYVLTPANKLLFQKLFGENLKVKNEEKVNEEIFRSTAIAQFAPFVIKFLSEKNPKYLLGDTVTNKKHDDKRDLVAFLGLYRVSSKELEESDLRSGENPLLRYDPTPIIVGDEYWYVTNQWNGQGDYPLSYDNLVAFVKSNFPLYSIIKEEEEYVFLKAPSELLPFIKYKLYSELNHNLAKSLLSKPFVILTGASGTGKTMQAKEIAKHFSNRDNTNSAVVAVGADWTDNRATLGFVNYLTAEGEEPVYQSTEILNLLLRANADLNTPYFLILDEMNLSHVERYFADFLSVMEQTKDGKFNLHNEGADLVNSAEGAGKVPKKIDYPSNLFVIGTVNIDETTYMFSPKVLDRANVIEYKVSEKNLSEFLDDPREPEGINLATEGEAEQFLALARAIRIDDHDKIAPLSKNLLGEVKEDILTLFNIMQARRFEFAYRTASEISRYMKVSKHLAEDSEKWESEDWKKSLDEQILQKILPKLHGSVGRIGKLIAELAHFTHNPKSESYSKILSDIDKIDTKAVYPESFAKLKAMSETLREEQFVSFI